MNMRKPACEGKVRYWALGVSVVVHTVALGVFTGVQLSNPLRGEQGEKAVSMWMVETVIEKPVPKPKPKVEPIQHVQPKPEPKPHVKTEPKPLVVEKEEPVIHEPIPEPDAVVESALPAVAHEVEFFGQKSIVQRVCYVVDCSGSMYGQMYRVKEQLEQSILKLNPQQAFCVLFFMDGRQILMTGSGKLESATIRSQSRALELIGKVKPAGTTDAIHALECAMRLRDADGHYPEIIYFLTDGFDLDESGSQLFVETISGLRQSFAPLTVLHTIGFWPENHDQEMLETLARNTGGDYIVP